MMSAASSVYLRLAEIVGRGTEVSDELPFGYLLNTILCGSADLVRGFLRLRKPVLIARNVRIRGKRYIHWGKFVRLGEFVRIDGYAREGVRLGDSSSLGRGSVVTCTSHSSRFGVGLQVGNRSGFGDFCHFGASGGIRIGDDVIAGGFVSLHSQEHRFDDPSVPIRTQGTTERGIDIGDNCWLGAKVTVLDGTIIGSGSVVAAGSVVRGEFPPHSLLAGAPARIVRQTA